MILGMTRAFRNGIFWNARTEPPFVVAQAAVLILFLGLGIAATKRFHPPMPGGSNVFATAGAR